MDFVVFPVTSDLVFNYFFSLPLTFAIITAPILIALSFFKR